MEPIYTCILDEIAAERVTQADETPLKMHGDGSGKSLPGYMWTFLSHERIAYVQSAGRQAEEPPLNLHQVLDAMPPTKRWG